MQRNEATGQAEGPVPTSSDPVFAEDGSWFYWDEVWANKCGPFRTEAVARASLTLYCEFELEGTPYPSWS